MGDQLSRRQCEPWCRGCPATRRWTGCWSDVVRLPAADDDGTLTVVRFLNPGRGQKPTLRVTTSRDGTTVGVDLPETTSIDLWVVLGRLHWIGDAP